MGLFLFLVNLLVKKQFSYKNLIILSPIIGSIAVSLLFLLDIDGDIMQNPFYFDCNYIFFRVKKNI